MHDLDPNNALRSGHGFFPPNLVAIGHCEVSWPLLDPRWPLHDLWSQQCITLWSGILPTKFGGHRTLLSNLTPGGPRMTPAWPLPQQCITLWSGVLLTKFGGHMELPSKLTPTWPQLTPTWPLTTIMQRITLWSGVLPTKFGGHRALPSKLTPSWPQLTHTWPSTPAMHFSLVSNSSHQILVTIGHF